jgi:polyisoprenoid-binding protein YceI
MSTKLKQGLLSLVFLLTVGVSAQAAPVTYVFDTGHSTIGFAVKHMGVGTTRGSFTDYTGKFTFDLENVEASIIETTIQATSINTNLEDRDNHLRNADFLDVEKFPTITFQSKDIAGSVENIVIEGDLTIHGVTKAVTVPLEVSGPAQGMNGEVIGLTGEIMINRKDFGVSWNKILDNGGLAVADNVKIIIEIEAKKE